MYIQYSDIASYLNIDLASHPEGQALVTSLINAVCPFVDSYCNRTWTINNATQITEVFDGGTDTFFVKTPPIASIVSLSINGNVQSSDFYYNYGSYVKLFDKAESENQNVTIVYTTSANTIPADLKQVLIQWVAQMFKESDDAGKQTTRYMEGPEQVYFKQESDIPDFVLRVLDLYRLTPAF